MKKFVSLIVILYLMGGLFIPKITNAQSVSAFENLGPQVEYTNAIRGKVSYNSSGRPLYYTLLQGEPAKLAVIDILSNSIYDIQELSGSNAAWSIEVGNDQKVYIGGTPSEHLYRYSPDQRIIEDIGKATSSSKDTVIWDLAYDHTKNRVFGVTSYSANVFSYQDGVGFTELGQAISGKQYARSVAYDEKNDTLYIGLGSPAVLIKWNLKTNEKTNILPQEFQNMSSVYDLDIVDNQLFIKFEGKSVLLQYDLDKQQVVNTIDADSRGVSSKYNEENVIFYSYKGELYKYYFDAFKSEKVNSNLNGMSAVSLDYIKSPVGKDLLVGLAGNGGKFYSYQMDNQKFSMISLNLPPQSVEIFNIGSGINGKILSSGFISGSLSMYNPSTNTKEMYKGVGQVEAMEQVNQKMYFGVYPSSKLYEFDPALPWKASSNPKEVFSLGDVGQDRPVTMAADEKNNLLFIGTFPKRGYDSGALVIYDTSKNKITYNEEIVPTQSISSLAFQEDNDTLYIGTSVYSGKGDKSTSSAQLLAIDMKNPLSKPVLIPLPIGYSLKVSALTTTKDGKLWGIVDNKLFIYDIKNQQTMITPITSTPIKGMSSNESLMVGQDGNLYGTVQGTFFKVNTTSLNISIFRQNDVFNLAQDLDGNLYFNSGSNLWKINTSLLTKDIEINPNDIQLPHIPTIESPYPVARVYAKKALTLYKDVNGAMIPESTLKAKGFYRVYGTKGRYYHVGGGNYIYQEDDKVSTYIGRIYSNVEVPIYKPDGSLFRMITPGEELRVYDYDDKQYDVGNGYYVSKDINVIYYVGTATVVGDTSQIYRFGEDQPVMSINPGAEYLVYSANDGKLDIGNGLYIEYDKNMIDYRKN